MSGSSPTVHKNTSDFELYSLNSDTSKEYAFSVYSNKSDYSSNGHITESPSNTNKHAHLSLGKSLSKRLSNLIEYSSEAVDEDTDDPQKLNKLLESRFEMGDAMRLEYSKDDVNNNDIELTSNLDYHSRDNETKNIDNDDNMTLNKVFTNKTTGQLELPPDKGYAWVMVLCVFLVMFNTWGCNAAFGVFLSFFFNHGTFEGATKYDYALIAGLPVGISQFCSPPAMILMRIIGIRQTMFIGCVLMLAGFLWASFATHLWELYMTQGFLTGLSIALVSVPPTACLPGWFLKRRAVSMGISLLGTGIGGVAFGMASNKMIEDYGNTDWCYRMLAITCTTSCLISVVLVRERIPVEPVGLRSRAAIWAQFQGIMNFDVIKKPQVLLITVWFNLSFFGYSLMVYTLSSYAVARGMSQRQGSILTTILNAGQTVGRPAMGLVGDRYGRRTLTSILTCILFILMFAFWIPASTFLQLIFFSIMVGSCVGVANVMNTVLIADTVPPPEFLTAWAFVMSAGTGPILCCELIAQGLTDFKNSQNPYLHTQIFTGCCFFCAFILSLVLRQVSIRSKLKT